MMKIFDKLKKEKKKTQSEPEYAETGRTKLSFAAQEAYRFLRTNITFALSMGEEHAVFGVTSSLKGEGKSTTSLNLAYTMADSGKKVLLLEGDMRLPVLAKRLNVPLAKGLSDVLAGAEQPSKAVAQVPDHENLYFMQAGTVPPNPSELLGSSRMDKLIEGFRQLFDYVIIDLSPVQIVTDALVVGKKVDGLVIVVRQDYVDRKILDDTVRQIRAIEAKILGFIMTHGKLKPNKYGRYKRYGLLGRYYKKNGYYYN